MNLTKKIVLIFSLSLILMIISCERPTDPANENEMPNTTVANIPREGDTLFALQTIHWDGEDNDGFVAGYQYRYITYRLFMNDSIVQEWKFTKQTSLTIAFVSDDNLNKQVFQVRSVDNNDAVDPTPAEKIIYTRKTIFPTTEIAVPVNNQEYFAVDQITDWWQGLELNYSAKDNDEGGAIIEYAWAVDNGEWNWTLDTAVFITPDEFTPPLAGLHTIRVTSRDNTNLIDPIGDSVVVKLIKPTFTKKILIIDETDETKFPQSVIQSTDQEVDNFYSEIFHSPDMWDFRTKGGVPPRDSLGQYQMIIWHADDLPTTAPHQLPANIGIIKDYLNVGGKFLMSGWRILKSFAWTDPFPFSFSKGDFIHDYLHIVNVDETPAIGDLRAAEGVGGFSTTRIDSSKFTGFPLIISNDVWGLTQVNLITQPAGFTDKIYIYQNANSSTYTKYRGMSIGLRYYGSVFDAVILGFPMYFLIKSDAQIMADEILSSLNIN